MDISYTSRSSFKRCRRAYKLSKDWVSKMPNPNLWFGTQIHEAIQNLMLEIPLNQVVEKYLLAFDNEYSRLETENKFIEMPPKQTAFWQEKGRNLGRDMIENFYDWLNDYGFLTKYKILAIEPSFRANITPIDFFTGRIDAIVEDNVGGKWLVEIKTTNRYMTHTMVDDQSTSYLWAMSKAFGYKLQGVLYLQIKKDIKHPIPLLKSGKLSTSESSLKKIPYKQLKTYIEKFEPESSALLDKITWAEHPYIKIEEVTRNETELINFEYSLMQELQDLKHAYDNDRFYKSVNSMQCGGCFFNYICKFMDNGSDWISVMQQDFNPIDKNRIQSPIDFDFTESDGEIN